MLRNVGYLECNIIMDNCHEENEEPPLGLDIASRRFSSVSIFLRQVFRYINRMVFVCPVRGSGLRRRNINLLDI